MKALIAAALVVIFACVASAGDYFVPKRGQTYDQLIEDKAACYAWATKQTGFDPMERFRAAGTAAAKESDAGGLFEGVRTREQRKQEEQARREWEAKMTGYERVVAVCMEERGYAVL